MATKAIVTGVVVSDKMQKTVKVAIERQVRDPLYGKTSRRTSTFLAHDEKNEAKVGDRKSTRLNSSHSGESRMPSSA